MDTCHDLRFKGIVILFLNTFMRKQLPHFSKKIFDFATAGEWDNVAAHYYSFDYIFFILAKVCKLRALFFVSSQTII